MVGMVYLPRLFVDHAAAAKGSPESETFTIMERRLERMIMRPACIVTWASGIVLVFAWGIYRRTVAICKACTRRADDREILIPGADEICPGGWRQSALAGFL